jgi:hypothetical protein
MNMKIKSFALPCIRITLRFEYHTYVDIQRDFLLKPKRGSRITKDDELAILQLRFKVDAFNIIIIDFFFL